jgi:hypothetical protein
MEIRWFGRLFLLFSDPADEYVPRVILGRLVGDREGSLDLKVKEIYYDEDGIVIYFEEDILGVSLLEGDEEVAQLLSKLQP